MRLLVVTQYFWPENFRINDLVGELVRRGHQVTVLTGLPNYPDGQVFSSYRADPKKFMEYKGAEIVRVPLIPRGNGGLRLMLNYLSFTLTATFFGLWKLRGRQFDAIFTCQLSPVTVGLPAAALRKSKNCPMAMWILDLWPDSLQAVGVVKSPSILRQVENLTGFIYKNCDLILAQSKSFIPKIRKIAKEKTRIEYFPSWAEEIYDQEKYNPAPEVESRTDFFNVMFAGNIGDAQDFPAILNAAEILKPNKAIRWLIVGDGRTSTWVKQEIHRRNLQDCVQMLGRHPVERMPSFFRHSDALLVSLKDEPIFSMTIPGKIQSYLASGIPIIAMLNGEGADVIRNSRSGLTCNAGDSNGLANAITIMSNMSQEELASMGGNGLSASKNEFDRQKLMDKLEGWLSKIKKKQ